MQLLQRKKQSLPAKPNYAGVKGHYRRKKVTIPEKRQTICRRKKD
jgi:hypothetical protein